MDLRPVPLIVDDGSPEGTDYDAPRLRVVSLPDELAQGPGRGPAGAASAWRVVTRLLQRGVEAARRWLDLRHHHA